MLSHTVPMPPESQLLMHDVELGPDSVPVQQACVPQSLGLVHW